MFIYFSEDKSKLSEIVNQRFWDVPESSGIAQVDVEVGPSGKPGTLSWYAPFGTPNAPSGFKPEQQEWIDCDGWWLGYQNELPKPESLQRNNLVTGYENKLNDGNVWLCPIVRRHQVGGTFPNVPYVMSKVQGWRWNVKEQYLDAWGLSGEIWDRNAMGKMLIVEMFEVSVQFLSVNYRIGMEEASVLQLMDAESMEAIIQSAIDIPGAEQIVEELKKKTA